MRILLCAALILAGNILAPGHAVAATLNVQLSPEITFDVPDGWNSCDADDAAKLHSQPAGPQTRALCDGLDRKGGARLVSEPKNTLFLSFATASTSDFPFLSEQEWQLAMQRPEMQDVCKSTFKISTPCVLESRSFGARQGYFFRGKTADGKYDRYRMLFLQGGDNGAVFILAAISADAGTEASMDAIVSSIRVSGEAVRP